MRKIIVLTLLLAGTANAQQHSVYMEDINPTTDACTDFFDYANGAWRASHPIPASMDRWSRRWAAGEQNKEQLRAIVEDISKRRDWPKGSVEQQISDFYGSCMDEAAINKAGTTPIKPILVDIDKMATRSDLQAMLARLHDLEVFAPFTVQADNDNHNPAQVISFVLPSGLGLPDRDYYFKEEKRFVDTRAKYREHIAKMFELTGSKSAAAKSAAETIFKMETRLAAARLDNVARRDPNATDHKMTVADLQKMTPHFDWKRYLDRTGVPPSDVNVNEPKYMAAVENELATTTLPTWKSYLKWTVIRSAAPHLNDELVNENFAFYGAFLRGAKEQKPRWKRCVETANSLLGEALGQKYVERYFPPEAKARMQELVKNLLSAMGDTIRRLDWMGPETKQKALEKLSTFNPKVGYPDKWRDYSAVKVTPDSYWSNVVSGRRNDIRDNQSQIGKPTDRGRWEMTPSTSDAYYNASLNEIVFPAGILQPPAFDNSAVDAVNYGAIGVVIGHEISHGFDDRGAKFDAQGRLANWWTAEDLKRFNERTKCVSDQFESYFIEPNIHHNGRLVLGESIGDLAGAKLAYMAYQKAQKTTPATTINGLTPDQQFFVAWGQFRGDETRPETQRMMIQGDPHPVAKYRVIGPLSNMPDFAAAFGCKADAAMVRAQDKRCEVW